MIISRNPPRSAGMPPKWMLPRHPTSIPPKGKHDIISPSKKNENPIEGSVGQEMSQPRSRSPSHNADKPDPRFNLSRNSADHLSRTPTLTHTATSPHKKRKKRKKPFTPQRSGRSPVMAMRTFSTSSGGLCRQSCEACYRPFGGAKVASARVSCDL